MLNGFFAFGGVWFSTFMILPELRFARFMICSQVYIRAHARVSAAALRQAARCRLEAVVLIGRACHCAGAFVLPPVAGFKGQAFVPQRLAGCEHSENALKGDRRWLPYRGSQPPPAPPCRFFLPLKTK